MDIKSGEYSCKYCGKPFVIREQYTQQKDDEVVLCCPWCSETIGEYNTQRNHMFIVSKGIKNKR